MINLHSTLPIKAFLFDLDSTITKIEILPTIALEEGFGDEMQELTEKTMRGEIPFRESFQERVCMLANVPVSKIKSRITQIPLHENLVNFIQQHAMSSYIVTGNIDVWISGLLARIGLPYSHCFCSSATVSNDKIRSLNMIQDKEAIAKAFSVPFLAVGDGSNDIGMLEHASIAIAFGGVRVIPIPLLEKSDYAVYDENRLCSLLDIISNTTR